MLESEIENKLKKEIETLGGLSLKFTSPGMAGVPDRLVLLPKGKICFVEVKAPGKSLRPLQIKRKEQLENLGFKVYLIDSYERLREVLDEIYTTWLSGIC